MSPQYRHPQKDAQKRLRLRHIMKHDTAIGIRVGIPYVYYRHRGVEAAFLASCDGDTVVRFYARRAPWFS